MTGRAEAYRRELEGARGAAEITSYLERHSGLPGPRANLELAFTFARTAEPALIRALAALEPDEAPENTPRAYLAVCGVLGLGRLALEGDRAAERAIGARAADPRWRVREAAAMALQLVGDQDRPRFTRLVSALAAKGPLEQRAAVAAVAEPRLLEDGAARPALKLLEGVTRSLGRAPRPLGERERVLRQALAYAWSVVVAADPAAGKKVMERFLASGDPDLRWAMRENLKKKRLQRLEPAWCAAWTQRLGATSGTSRAPRS
jgi:hypothetical protein